ncbi:MAG: S24/S26 family peptidase [Bacteroidaceae bacterium]|nr:S24/S26 family peptidase [Bacteroidaceae bacterium]
MRTVSLPNEIFVPQVRAFLEEGQQFVTFRVRGNSMRPFLENERDCVALVLPGEVEVGDVVLAEVAPKHYVLHRIIIKSGDDLVLKGDGNVKGIETCTVGDVVAQAVGFYRKGRRRADLVTGWKWRSYSWLWVRLRPLRRYLLAAYRRIWLRVFPVKMRDVAQDKEPPAWNRR